MKTRELYEGSKVTNSERPLVSIITPSYNQAEFIEETILSVKKQDYPNIEHIIVDGGSTDDTLDILKCYEDTYNMCWLSEPDNGQSEAGNKGFSMARGKIIGWLNSDDVYFYKQTISRVVKCFGQRPNIDVVYGDLAVIDERGLILKIDVAPNFTRSRLHRGIFIPHPASFIRRTVSQNYNLNTNLDYVMDLDFFLTVSKKYRFFHLGSVLAAMRHHTNRKTFANKEAFLKERNKVLAKFGQKFGLKYKLGRFWDTSVTALFRRLAELYKILQLTSEDGFAFPAKLDSRWQRFRRLAKLKTDESVDEMITSS